ncbi:MAG: hypothetical protein JXA92_13685, partial [candidate division Zixibacteria bacterium]|nr:hypothetical protein [candidate division Zixibacteria bacterium]
MSKKFTILMLLLLVLCGGTLFGERMPQFSQNIPELFTPRVPGAGERLKAEAVAPDVELDFIGSCLWSQTRDVWADDDYLFVLFYNILVVYSYYHTEPEYLCHVYFPGAARSFYRYGDYFYIAAGYDGLFIIDVAMTVEDPYLVGRYNTPGFANEVVVSDEWAYIADGDGGLQIIDVHFPQAPAYLGSYDQLHYTANVAINGNLAYVGDTLNSLHIVLVSEPSLPIKMGEYNSPSRFRDLAVVDTLAFLGSEFSDGLQIVDVSQANNPVLLSNYGIPSFIIDLFIKDSLAIFPDGDGYFEIVNIADPENPAFISEIFQCGGAFASNMKLYVHDKTLFSTSIALEGCSGVCLIGINNPASPSYILDFGYCWMSADVEVVDSLLYTADFWGGINIFNIKNPAYPVHRGS